MYDTKGVAGSPDIVATVLAKIEAAKVFVGDVTPIAVSRAGKALANPNVLIELGYAKRTISLERVILVWNTAYDNATIEQLPSICAAAVRRCHFIYQVYAPPALPW